MIWILEREGGSRGGGQKEEREGWVLPYGIHLGWMRCTFDFGALDLTLPTM